MKRSLHLALVLAGASAFASHARAADDGLKSLTVCADPGNMPLSNQKGEGFQNKIAQVLGKELGTGVSYYWRPSIERGLMRTTLSEGNCDLWMDMAADTEGAIVTAPLYRSTFVLAYRKDKGFGKFQSLNEPRLQNLRIGVFQMSAARQALSQHGIMTNTVVGPGHGDAAVIRIKGTDRALAMKTDCNPRYCYLEPYSGGMLAVLEAARP